MASVASNRDLHRGIRCKIASISDIETESLTCRWLFCGIAILGGRVCSGDSLRLLGDCCIFEVELSESRSQGINIERGVFSVVYADCIRTVSRLKALISDGCDFIVDVRCLNIKSLEPIFKLNHCFLLIIIEIKGISSVFHICRVSQGSYSSVVWLVVFNFIHTQVSIMYRNVETSAWVFFVNSYPWLLCKRLCEKVFCLNARNESLISRDILCFHVLSWSSHPVWASSGSISKLYFLNLAVNRGSWWVKCSLRVIYTLPVGKVETVTVVWRLSRVADDDAVCISWCTTEDLHLLWDVTCITR